MMNVLFLIAIPQAASKQALQDFKYRSMQRLIAFHEASSTVAHLLVRTVVYAPEERPVQSDAFYR